MLTAAVAVALALHPTCGAEAMDVLAPQLTAETAHAALRRIDTMQSDRGFTAPMMAMIGALAARLDPDEARDRVARHVDIELRLTTEPEIAVAERLAPFAEYLHRDTVRMTLCSICRGIGLTGDMARDLAPSLKRMAPRVARDPGLVQEAFAVTFNPSVWRPDSRLVVLAALAPHLSDEALDEAMRQVPPGPIEVECFSAVAALSRAIPGQHGDTEIGRRALNAALTINNDRQRLKAITELAPALQEDLATEALEFIGSMTHRVPSPTAILAALNALAPQLPAHALPRALTILMDTPLAHAGEVAPRASRLIERLCRDDRTGAILSLLHARKASWDPKQSWTWAIAPYLSAALTEQAVTAARQQPDDVRLISLAALTPRLPEGLRAAAAHEVLDLLDVVPSEMITRMTVLARLAEARTASAAVATACERLVHGLQANAVHRIDGGWEACLDLLRHLPDDTIQAALDFSTRTGRLDYRCQILAQITPRLPASVVPGLVAEIEGARWQTGSDWTEQARALVALATRIQHDDEDEDERNRILATVLVRMINRRSWFDTGPAFIDMMPLLPRQLRSRAVASALEQCLDNHEAVHAAPLIDILHTTELEMALRAIAKISDPHRRARMTAATLRRSGELSQRSTEILKLDALTSWPPGVTRGELFTLVGASAWWIRHQGDGRAATATIDTIFDVTRWWR